MNARLQWFLLGALMAAAGLAMLAIGHATVDRSMLGLAALVSAFASGWLLRGGLERR